MASHPGDSPDGTALPVRFLNPWRLRWYPRAVLVALVAALVITALTADGVSLPTGGRLGGDFPAFYAAGAIVAAGDADDLYDPERQATAQADLFPDEGYLYFAYPPFVAAAYRPLAALPYRWAYLVNSLAMVAALALAIWLAGPLLPIVEAHPEAALASALVFPPLFLGVFGGQNTAISLLLIVGAWRAMTSHRYLAAGAVAGLLLFKPQFGVLLILLLALSGNRRVPAGAAISGSALYLAGAAVSGLDWPRPWLDQARAFNTLDIVANPNGSASAWGAMSRFGTPAEVLVIVALSAIIALLIRIWLQRPPALGPAMALTAASLPLVPPHALFYDASIGLVTVAILAHRLPSRRGKWLGLLWLVGLPVYRWISLPVPFFAAAALFLVAAWWLRTSFGPGRMAAV